MKQISRLVYDYKILSTQQIERLMGKSQSPIQQVLRRMWDGRYLDRVFPLINIFGSQSAFHILDRKGIDLLKRGGITEFKGLPSKDSLDMFIKHTVAISEFRIQVMANVEQYGWSIPIWRTEQEIKTDYDRVHIPNTSGTVALVPDSYFYIQVPNKGKAHFFLELDRGKMQQSTFQQKIEAYVAYYKSGAFTKRYKAKGFRVLTVVENESDSQLRVKNLADASEEVQGIGRRFWFAHLPVVQKTDLLFDPIWYIAGADKRYSLFYPEK